MQTSQSMERWRRIIIIAAIVLLGLLLVMVALGWFRSGNRSMAAVRLRCVATQDVTPFGENVLYYDGMTLFCLTPQGKEKWSYTLGENASFSCSDTMVAAWSGAQIHIVNRNGQPSYNEDLSDVIQFARVGAKYVAVVLGEDVSPTLLIKDMQGTTVDTINSYEDMLLLDVGFFADGEYLWTTALDIYGTVPNTVMHTYRVNLTNSGEISLGQNLTYAIIYAGNELNVISTRQLRQYDYRCTQDQDGTVLVYGWQLVHYQVSGSRLSLLFTRSSQSASMNQLRLLQGATDKRFTLPSACVGAALYNNHIYAFSEDTLYRADVNARRFDAISLPGDLNGQAVTGYLGMLKNGVALVTCDSDVYTLTLP